MTKKEYCKAGAGAVAMAAVLILGMAGPGFAASSGKIVNLLTNPAGTGNYTISVAQAQVITKKTDIRVIVQPTQGPVVIADLLENGDGKAATLSSMGTYWAYSGTGDYKKPYKFVRVLQSGNLNYFALVTREDLGIKTISDLKGKRVTYFVTSLLTKDIIDMELKAHNLDQHKDITLLKAESTPRALNDLLQGRTDAVACSLGGAKMVEVNSKKKLLVLPFAADKVPFLRTRLPGMVAAVTPADRVGIPPGVPVVATPVLFIGVAGLDNALAYGMVKGLIANYSALKAINPELAEWKPEAAVRDLPIPYHPGAIKYYKEQGLWNGDMDKLQKSFVTK